VARQNRVTPFGAIVADPARGTLTGNRGILCDAPGRLARRRWTTKAWIACEIAFRGRRRPVMRPGTWTELFFLDEATALAAGHRPCAYCRRADFEAFRAALARGLGLAVPPRAPEIDARLHAERLTPPGAGPRVKRLWPMATQAVPAGAMAAVGAAAWLRTETGWRQWTPAGYGPATAALAGQADGPIAVLTPPTVCAALVAGWRPRRHPTAPEDPGHRPA
jgi:hypothetical protein